MKKKNVYIVTIVVFLALIAYLIMQKFNYVSLANDHKHIKYIWGISFHSPDDFIVRPMTLAKDCPLWDDAIFLIKKTHIPKGDTITKVQLTHAYPGIMIGITKKHYATTINKTLTNELKIQTDNIDAYKLDAYPGPYGDSLSYFIIKTKKERILEIIGNHVSDDELNPNKSANAQSKYYDDICLEIIKSIRQ